MITKNYYRMFRLLSVTFTLFLPLLALWAAPVDKEHALQKARQFYSSRGQTSKMNKLRQVPRSVNVSTAMENDCFYVFTAGTEDGFVIISGDDRTEPVLGYSESGTFNADDMPSNMKAWLDGYADQIRTLQKQRNDDPTADSGHGWAMPAKLPTHAAVAPLVTSKWDQGDPYNMKCPVFFDESKYGRTVTGCVATAMAQVINFHKYPASTTQKIPGYTCRRDWKDYLEVSSSKYITVPAVAVTSLDWSNMLDKYDGSETAAQKNAVATLMQACGAAVEMDYGIREVGGSSASSTSLKKALTTYFDYDKSMKLVCRTDYTATEWDQLIYAEMAARRPVCFGGASIDGGHQFVVDGYDGDGYYHVNWGWGGMHNGYYLLGILTPADDSGIGAGQGGYNAYQDALIGIRPNTGGDHPAIAVLTTDSIKVGGNMSFTRSGTNANFENVSVGASFWNRNGYTATFDFGYGVYDVNGNLKAVSTLRTNASLQNTYGLRCYKSVMSLKFGSGWANGKYRIVPVSRRSSTSQWLPCSGSNTLYILAVINGNTLELSYPWENMNVGLALTNTPEAGGPADLKITIANNGADYIGHVLLYSPDLEDGKYVYEDLVEIKAGETQTRVASVSFPEAGTYTVVLALDSYDVLAYTSVTVTEAKTHALTCSYNVKNGNSSTRTIDGSTMELDITYKNTGSNTYDNEVTVGLLKKVAENSYEFACQKTDRLTLAKGASVTRSYTFTDLEDEGVYWARAFYQSAGETKYSGSTALYTVHNTSTPAVKEAYAVVSGSTLSFYYDEKMSSRSGKKYAMNNGSDYPGWAVDSLSVTKSVFDASFAAFTPTTTAHWFDHFVNLANIQGLAYLNTSSVTSMQSMFYECYALESVDVSGFDTRNVTNMKWMFYGCSTLKSLNVKNFNTSKVTSMRSMFYNCSSLTSLDVTSFDTQNVTDMGWMFFGCQLLKSLNVKNFNTSKVTSMRSMFYNCSSLTSLDVTSFNTQKVAEMQYMFFDCTALTQLNVSSFNTANATLMNNMFTDCEKLTSLDLSNFNTANVTDMNRMFYGCTALTQLNVSSFNTAKVTNMHAMFYNNENLTSLDLSNFKTPAVTDLAFMFRGCSKLTEIDLSGITTPNVTEMRVMFWGCSSLTTIYVKNNWDTSKATSSDIMFENCNSLVGGMGTRYNANYTDKTYARIDGGTASPGYFTKASTSGKEAYAVLSNGTLTFYYDGSRSSRSGKSYDLEDTYTYDSHPAWQADSLSIGAVAFNQSFANYRPTSTAHWFTGYYSNLTTFTGMENLNTENVTNMDNMFSLCKSLRILDVSHFNTSKVTNMHCMFYGCSSLQTLEVGGFDTRKVANFQAMFYNCSSLIALDVERFNTENAFYLNFMFYGCSKINLLDVSNFNTKNAILMEAMFDNCSSVKSLDLRNFNTLKVENLSYLFYGCTSLVEVNLSSFDTTNATSLRSMFYNCSALTTIYTSHSWNTSKVTDSQFMFTRCVNIVGGAGTMFNSNYTDKTYARLDVAGTPGYFTYKAVGRWGDVNSDGTVDVADIATIIQTMGRGRYDSLADVNSDKVVDVADIATVISIMAANARRLQQLEEAEDTESPQSIPPVESGSISDGNVVTSPFVHP